MSRIEYEVRVLEIDKDEIQSKLKELNATLIEDVFQRRYVYDFNPINPNKWIRLRTNGTRSTLTIKNIVSSTIDGTRELEVEVGDFERCHQILEELGFEAKGYQENRRVQYSLNGVEIDIDYWPMIPTYLEIEGLSEEAVYEVLSLLGFKKEDATNKDVEGIYLDYGYDINKMFELKLEEERK